MGDDSEQAQAQLEAAVRARMAGASEASVEVVVAMASLLARVAYADRRYDDAEALRVRDELRQVLGFSEPDVNAISVAIAACVDGPGAAPVEHSAEVLRRHLDVHMRADTVKVLIEVATADREIASEEERIVRAVSRALWVDEPLLEALLQRARQLLRR